MCEISYVIREISQAEFDADRLTPAHLRAARALLGWLAKDLAERAGLGVATVRRAELGDPRITYETRVALVRALDEGGVTLTLFEGQGPGAYLKAPATEI